jgi:hypothetical protein
MPGVLEISRGDLPVPFDAPAPPDDYACVEHALELSPPLRPGPVPAAGPEGRFLRTAGIDRLAGRSPPAQGSPQPGMKTMLKRAGTQLPRTGPRNFVHCCGYRYARAQIVEPEVHPGSKRFALKRQTRWRVTQRGRDERSLISPANGFKPYQDGWTGASNRRLRHSPHTLLMTPIQMSTFRGAFHRQ